MHPLGIYIPHQIAPCHHIPHLLIRKDSAHQIMPKALHRDKSFPGIVHLSQLAIILRQSGHLILFAKFLSVWQSSICSLAAHTVLLRDHCNLGVPVPQWGAFDLQGCSRGSVNWHPHEHHEPWVFQLSVAQHLHDQGPFSMMPFLASLLSTLIQSPPFYSFLSLCPLISQSTLIKPTINQLGSKHSVMNDQAI